MKEVLDRFVSYFTLVMRQNTLYFAKFVLCEILNVVVLAFNFYVTNSFFSYKWGRYGFEGWIGSLWICFYTNFELNRSIWPDCWVGLTKILAVPPSARRLCLN